MFSWQIAEGVKPTLAELEKFEDTPEGAEVECRLHLLVHSKIIGHMIHGKHAFSVRRDKLKRSVCHV